MKAAVTVWGAVFLAFLIIFAVRTGVVEPATRAAKDMPVSHLIQADDLGSGTANNALVGRYLRRSVAAEQLLTPRDVSSVPILAADHQPIFAVHVPSASIRDGSINAKKKTEICRDSEAIASGEVAATLCPPDATLCLGLVYGVQPQDTAKVVAELTKPSRSDLRLKPRCKASK